MVQKRLEDGSVAFRVNPREHPERTFKQWMSRFFPGRSTDILVVRETLKQSFSGEKLDVG